MIFDGTKDIGMSFDGDILVENGDFRIISGYDWAKREINKVLRTENPEWTNHSSVGAGLESFVGQTNTRDVADDIKLAISRAAERQGFLFPANLEVRVVPTGINSIQIFLNINADGTKTTVGELIFDFRKGALKVPIDELQVSATKVEYDRRHKKNDNKYLNRRR